MENAKIENRIFKKIKSIKNKRNEEMSRKIKIASKSRSDEAYLLRLEQA